MQRNFWDSVTRAFFHLKCHFEAHALRKSLTLRQTHMLARAARPKLRMLTRLAFSKLATYARSTSLVLRAHFFRWQTWFAHQRQKLRHLGRVLKRNSQLRVYFRCWLTHTHNDVRDKLNQVSQRACEREKRACTREASVREGA